MAIAEGKAFQPEGKHRAALEQGIHDGRQYKETKAFIYNDADRVGLASYDASSLRFNEDGSVHLCFGETTPKGPESNGMPTAGEEFILIFRFYGPEEAVFDKCFKLPDVEKTE